MNERPRQSVIGVMDEKNNNLRYITMIGHLPFYQSSGRNSREKGTWFPFMGLQEKGMGKFLPKGMFLKPPTDINTNFPEELSQYLNKNKSLLGEMVQRFGNFEAMSLSMLIGGGFWSNDEGIQLRSYILQHYENETRFLYDVTRTALADLKQLSGNEKIISINEPESINTWLSDHGLTNKNQLDFNYNTIKIQKTDLSINSNVNDALLDQIDNAIKAIKESASWYRTEAKAKKITVLEAGRKCVKGEISKSDFEQIISRNKNYDDSIGTSKTKEIVKNIFNEVDRIHSNKQNTDNINVQGPIRKK
jgi:hypothetical protein